MSSDPLGRYYTDSIVSNMAVETIGIADPPAVLDLAYGDGSLGSAAKARWQRARIVGVDVRKPPTSFPDEFLRISALSRKTQAQLGRKFQVAICNPPFTRPSWSRTFEQILGEVGLSERAAAYRDTGATVLFLAQNLRLLEEHGELAIIVPDPVLTSEKTRELRTWLTSNFTIKQILQLPRSFKGTEAQTHLITLKNSKPATNHKAIFSRLNADGTQTQSIKLSLNQSRLDYNYLSATNKTNGIPLKDIVLDITRGSWTSVEARARRASVIHTDNFPKTIRHSTKRMQEDDIAQPGDILICRIGRGLERRICSLKAGTAQLSDCIFRLRIEDSYTGRVFAYLSSAQGRANLQSRTQGVAARYLTVNSILEMVIPH